MVRENKNNLKKLGDVLAGQRVALQKVNGALKNLEVAMKEFNSLLGQIYAN